ncbi:MAG TPA: ABC transporter substrate-binding protein [Burkholderiaceae bacterium]
MAFTRRTFGLGVGAVAGTAALGLSRAALAQDTGPIRIGWLAALTGPSSAPGVGMNRGVMFAVEAINAAGGVKGRKIELITRDTQGDPTKAVNAAQEMVSQLKVHAVWGPTNSGESLAVTPILARAKIPMMHPTNVQTLIDPVKFPNAFRNGPANNQFDDAVRGYCLNVLKARKLAVMGDATGYGVTAVKASVEGFKKDGAEVVHEANFDATQTDMTPDLLRAKNAGAQAIVIWSVSTAALARIFNTRAAMGWDVPIVGHPTMASGEIGALLEKPANWQKVYAIGYRSCSYDAAGALPKHTQELLERLKGKVNLNDTLLWWVAVGIDGIELIAKAVAATGSSAGEAIIGHWNTLTDYPGYFGTYTFSPTQHNGYRTAEIVMSQANSAKSGTFALAPGY